MSTRSSFVKKTVRDELNRQMSEGMPEMTQEEKTDKQVLEECQRKSKELWKTYAVIRLEPQRGEMDIEQPTVCIDGNNIQFKRGVPVPVPVPFIEALRNANYPVYSQEAGKDRVDIGTVSRFPFSVLRMNVPENEYQALRKIAKERDLTEKEVFEPPMDELNDTKAQAAA